MEFWIYLATFVVIGIPLIGYVVLQGIELGKWAYKKYPFIQNFFDQYAENFGIGLIITVVTAVIYIVARWLGFV